MHPYQAASLRQAHSAARGRHRLQRVTVGFVALALHEVQKPADLIYPSAAG